MKWFSRRDDNDARPAPFDPEPVDIRALRARVLEHIDRLLPHAVDEATPYVLDDWIDRSIEVEVARRIRALVRYQDELEPYMVAARAELAYETIMNDAAHCAMAELRSARIESVLELLGLAVLPPEFQVDNPPAALPDRAQEEE